MLTFLADLPDDGGMFAPEVVRCDAGGLDVKSLRCPAKQARLDAGLAEEEVPGGFLFQRPRQWT